MDKDKDQDKDTGKNKIHNADKIKHIQPDKTKLDQINNKINNSQ